MKIVKRLSALAAGFSLASLLFLPVMAQEQVPLEQRWHQGAEQFLDRMGFWMSPLVPSCRLPAPARFYEEHGENYSLSLGLNSALIIGRAAWGAQPAKPEGRSWSAYPADQPFCGFIQHLTVHHTHSLYTIRSLQEFHQNQADPKADIGYHFFIDQDGVIYEGRPLGYMGSHSEGDNSNNVGIVLNGDFQEKEPDPRQIAALRRLVGALRCPCAPIDGLWTHQQRKGLRFPGDPAHFTACPGQYLAEEVSWIAKDFGLGPILREPVKNP